MDPDRLGRFQLLQGLSPDDVWRSLYREYRWVYSQMNRRLREIFWPFFFYAELRTVTIAVRSLEREERLTMEATFGVSLLCEEIKSLFRTARSTASAVAGLERVLVELSASFAGLSDIYRSAGMRGFEKELVGRFLVYGAGRAKSPEIAGFFSQMIDARNLLALYKALRFESTSPGTYLPGGRIRETRLLEIQARGDLFRLGVMVRAFTGVEPSSLEPSQVETALYRGTTRTLRRRGIEPSGIGAVLDYLWRCSVEATNRSLLAAMKEADPGRKAEALVR